MGGRLASDGAAARLDGVILQNTTWGRRELVNGADFTQTVTYGGSLAEGVLFEWDWPEVSPRRVLGYPQMIVGRKPWLDATAGDLLPLPLSETEGLTARWSLDWGGEGGFNVAFDLWLSTSPDGGPEAVTQEVMVWLRPGEGSPAGRPVAEVEIDGRAFDLWRKDAPHGTGGWGYAAFVAREPAPDGVLDLGALLEALEATGPLGEGLWLTSVELGAEVTGGAGWMRATEFSVTRERSDESEAARATLPGFESWAAPSGGGAAAMLLAPEPPPDQAPERGLSLVDLFF